MDPLHVPVPQAPGDLEQGGHAVDHGGGGADGDERVHIGRTLEQAPEAHLVILVVDVQDGKGQQKLEKGGQEHVPLVVEEGGQRPAHHVPHGQIEQRDQENE